MAVGQHTHEGSTTTEQKPHGHLIPAFLVGTLITVAAIAVAQQVAANNPELVKKLLGQQDPNANNNGNPGLVLPATDIPTQAPLPTAENPFTPLPTFTPIDIPTETEVPTDEPTAEQVGTFDWNFTGQSMKMENGREINLNGIMDTIQDFQVYKNPDKNQAFPNVNPGQIVVVRGNDGVIYFDQDDALNRSLFAQGCTVMVTDRNSVGLGFLLNDLGIFQYGISSGQIHSNSDIHVKYPNKDKTGQLPEDTFPTSWIVEDNLYNWTTNFDIPTNFVIYGSGTDVIATSNDNLTPEQWNALILDAKANHNQLGSLWNIRIYESDQEVDAYVAFQLAHPAQK